MQQNKCTFKYNDENSSADINIEFYTVRGKIIDRFNVTPKSYIKLNVYEKLSEYTNNNGKEFLIIIRMRDCN